MLSEIQRFVINLRQILRKSEKKNNFNNQNTISSKIVILNFYLCYSIKFRFGNISESNPKNWPILNI